MKILLVTGGLGYRGTAKALLGYALILAKKHEVRVWAYDEGGDDREYGVTLRGCGIVVYGGHDSLSSALAFAPDIVNLHRPGIYRRRDLDVFEPFHNQGAMCIETNVFGRVDPSIAKCVDLSIQVSRWDLWQWNIWKKGRCDIPGAYCPNPVDCDLHRRISDEEITQVREGWGIPNNARILGRIGNTNWEILERPLLQCLKEREDLYFVHVDDHINYLPNGIECHPRVRRIPRLHGPKELSRFYSSCDVMASMSSIGESFGYVNAEAMACGTPVIALSTPLHCNAPTEVVVHGEGGYIIANPSELPIALRRMLEGDELQRLSKRARELVVERYSYPICEKILDRIFCVRKPDGEHAAPVGVVQTVSDEWIDCLVNNAIGEYPVFSKMLFKVYYSRLGGRTANFLRDKCSRVFQLMRKIIG